MKNHTIKILMALAGLIIFVQCAREGAPSGGPKDEDPPVFVKSSPLPDAINFTGKSIRISFNENIVLKDMFNNFVMSPPMEKDPIIKSIGSDIKIDFINELQPNTTYTLYFGQAVVDNNEGNPLNNFVFSFSTGEVIDSLMMSGILLDARTLNPVKNTLIGVHVNLADSAITKNVPLRITKTGENGMFTIMNLPDSAYHIFGWTDTDKNYRYNTGEQFSFNDSVYRPTFVKTTYADTSWLDTITVDTVIIRDTLVHSPEDIILMAYTEKRNFQTLKKKTRATRQNISFEFASAMVDTPEISLLDTTIADWYLFEPSITTDTLTYWVKDSALISKDTINVIYTYQVTDSLDEFIWETDTIALNFRDKNAPKRSNNRRQKEKEEEKQVEDFTPQIPPTEIFRFSTSIKSQVNYFGSIALQFPEPLESYIMDSIHLLQVVDSIETDLKFVFEADKNMPRRYFIRYKWDEEKKYALKIDSAAFYSIYGAVSNRSKKLFTVRGPGEFGTIIFQLQNANTDGFIELLNGKDEILKTLPFTSQQNTVTFPHLEASTYYARMYFDVNKNGQWDEGIYSEKIQPEPVYYFNKGIEVKKNWEYKEPWDVTALPIHQQKPEALKNQKTEKSNRR